jgi:undecaprenyl phosphate N,N'-diacetylbacillosamine 1-phosphate transferase
MYKYFIKRLIDIVISLIALPFVLLAIIIMAPIIYINDPGPIFYNATRRGKDGKTFKMFKLRSMYVNSPDLRNADGTTFNSSNDPRVTKVGRFMRKTSVDELPQLLNVLFGERGIIETTKKNADFSRVVTVNSISL